MIKSNVIWSKNRKGNKIVGKELYDNMPSKVVDFLKEVRNGRICS